LISLRFLGAAGTVTGSKYSLTVGDQKLLIDCGLFQGAKELRLQNWQPLPEAADGFQAMLLTHAHIDHSGYIPRLVRQGFAGRILCTSPTLELCELLLQDSAKIQQEEADYLNRQQISRHQPALPLYNEEDVAAALPLLKACSYGQKIQVLPGIEVTFHEAGHILGSAWLELDLHEPGARPIKLVMSGDLGRENAPILKDPEPPVECDYLVVEATYGDRAHSDEPIGPRLAEVVQQAVHQKGVLVIPAFAVERAQELIYILAELYAQRDIARIPVFLDSPMATQATHIFERHRDCYDAEARERVLLTGGLLNYRKLKLCETREQSKAIARTPPPYVVISASGMATGGRVLHHLRRHLPDPASIILLVGFQAEGTRGWRLQQGEKSVRIFAEDVTVRARVEMLDGFSGHADFRQINRWLQHLQRPPRRVFLVHGEAASLAAQQARIQSWVGWNAHVAEAMETVELC
jgi:metallo-beta-lactamase family protein